MLPVDIVIALTTLLIIAVLLTAFYSWMLAVPFVPTPRAVAAEMIRFAGLQGNERVFDLGAGSASILLEAKRTHPGIHATGVELSPTVWLLGKLKILFARTQIAFLRQDARLVSVRDANVIFLYLFPGMMAALEKKFNEELRPGTVVISHAFKFAEHEPTEKRTIPWGKRQKTVYKYVW